MRESVGGVLSVRLSSRVSERSRLRRLSQGRDLLRCYRHFRCAGRCHFRCASHPCTRRDPDALPESSNGRESGGRSALTIPEAVLMQAIEVIQ